MKWWRCLPLPFILIASLLVFPGTAEALTPEISLEEMARGADSIVVGTVVESTSQWNASRTRISTSVVTLVEQRLKGAPGQDKVTFTVPGGQVDGITEWVSDSPRFSKGERAVVFLQQLPDARFQVYRGAQGKFAVQQGKVGVLPLAEFKGKISQALQRTATVPGNEIWQPVGPISLDTTRTVTQRGIAPQQSVSPMSGWGTIVYEDFETTFPSGWSRSGTPTWATENYTQYAGSYSGWCAGSSLDPATSNYTNTMNAWMVYGPFSLSDASAAQLSYYRWVKTQTNDNFFVFASINETMFYGYYLSGQYDYWDQSIFDLRNWPTLGNLTGQPQVWLAFRFQSDASGTDKGVFLDNITLRKYVGAAPQISVISPVKASAGTDSQVSINGTGFGATAGMVYFFYAPDQPYISGNITAWSDTSINVTVPVGIINSYAASASSGPVVVVNADGVDSPPFPFEVSFSYGGIKWSGASPIINYLVNPNTNDCTGEEVAVRNAAATWNAVPDNNFVLNYAGATGATAAGSNGVNEIMWREFGAPGTLAHAIYWFYSSNGTIVETDMEFNDYYTWSTDTTPAPGTYDVETVALHELGHWLNLRDLYGNVSGYPQDANDVMFGFGSSSATKRVLYADDEAGIRWIYGIIYGDATGDRRVNSLDITRVERIIARLATSTPGADANRDGNVNALDITRVERIIVGLD